jgi:hypothetical protein
MPASVPVLDSEAQTRFMNKTGGSTNNDEILDGGKKKGSRCQGDTGPEGNSLEVIFNDPTRTKSHTGHGIMNS